MVKGDYWIRWNVEAGKATEPVSELFYTIWEVGTVLSCVIIVKPVKHLDNSMSLMRRTNLSTVIAKKNYLKDFQG